MIATTRVISYRSRPEPMEAMKLDGNAEQVLSWIAEVGQPSGDSGVTWDLDDFGPIYFQTPHGVVTARQGDYIVRRVNGEFHPCDLAAFANQKDGNIDKQAEALEAIKNLVEAALTGETYFLAGYPRRPIEAYKIREALKQAGQW